MFLAILDPVIALIIVLQILGLSTLPIKTASLIIGFLIGVRVLCSK
jgi:hypothetical protein